MVKADNSIEQLTYKPGDLVFTQGEMGYHFYIVESGRIQIFFTNKKGEKVEIAVVEEGESFGEFALLDKNPRSASAQAITVCKVAKISPEGYEQLLTELPAWAVSMLKSFAKRITRSNDLLKKVSEALYHD